MGLAGDQLGVLLATPAATQLALRVGGADLLRVLGDLGGDQTCVELLRPAGTPAGTGSEDSLNEPGRGPSPRSSDAADSTALTMFW